MRVKVGPMNVPFIDADFFSLLCFPKAVPPLFNGAWSSPQRDIHLQ